MVRVPTHRAPTHPGVMLREEFLSPMGLTQRELAAAIHVPYQRINEIVRGRRGMTPSTALRLAKYFGISADFWMNLQLRWDLYQAQQSEGPDLNEIKPMKVGLFDELVASVREGGAILRGQKTPSRSFAVPGPGVKETRSEYGLPQVVRPDDRQTKQPSKKRVRKS
jgi:addiction module HigA family antidote